MNSDPATPALNLRWTLSNALSALRIVLALPAGLAVMSDRRGIAAVLCVAAAATDVLDGYFARKWNEISDLGKILDPLADKIYVAVLVVTMLGKGLLPLWLVVAVLARDLAILAGGIYIERRKHVVLPSNYPGKIAVLTLSTMLLVVLLGVDQVIVNALMWLAVGLLAVSFWLYGARAVAALRSRPGAPKAESL